MTGRLRDALGPGGIGAVALLALWAGVRAGGLVLIADGLASAIAGLASGHGDVTGACVLAAVGAVLRAGATWAQNVTAARGAITAKARLRGDLARRIASDGATPSEAVLAADGIDALDDYYATAIPAAVSAVVITVAVGARILVADLPSAVAIGATIPLIPLFMILIGLHTRERSEAAQAALSRLADHLAELAHGLPVLVGLGRVAEQTEALSRIQDDYRRRTRATLRTAFLSALALELIATLSVAVVAVMLGIRLLSGDVALSTALVALLLAPECFSGLREVGAAYHASHEGRGALSRIRDLLARPRRRPAVEEGGAPRVTGLAVRYPGRRGWALRPTSATFPRGSITAVTGASGAGKSTLLAVLVGDLAPGAELRGAIAGVDPSRIAYAPQVVRTAAATVSGELLLYGADDPALLLAHVGLDHLADADPAQLSPGERRRLGIARVCARVEAGADLVVLDEPTAHLDAESARRVRTVIRRLRPRASIVLVSHDPETTALATVTLSLDGSGVAEPPVTDAAEHGAAAVEPVTGRAPALTRSPLATMLGLMRPAAGRWVAAVLVGLASSAAGLALIAVSGWLIVRAGSQPAIMYLLVAIVGVRFFGLARSVLRYVERLLTHDAAFALADRMRLRLWAAIATRGAGSRTLLEGGTAVDYVVTSTHRVRDLLPRVLTPAAVGVLVVVGAVVTTGFVVPSLVAAVASGLLITALAAGVVAAADGRGQQRRVRLGSELVRQFSLLAEAAGDLRANGVDARAAAGVSSRADRVARLERRSAWRAGLAVAVASGGTGLLAAAVPAWAGSDVPAELVAVVALLLLALAEPMASAALAVQRVPALSAALRELTPLLGEVPAVLPADGVDPRQVSALGLEGAEVTWPDAARPVFAGVTSTVTRSEWLVIDGPSGSGKSTLLSAILGALPVSAGRIAADGIPLTSIAAGGWSRRVAWCPQDAHVFDSTLRGNLLLARPRTAPVEDDEMHDVLNRVGLGALLGDLEDGLSTRVGRSGRALSGGERQRVAVARALLGGADVLLLDEPTAHLDEATARLMMSDIRRATRDAVVVLVSHRAEDTDGADHVIRLGAGAGVPAGDAAALVA